jgi:hypothetical protein
VQRRLVPQRRADQRRRHGPRAPAVSRRHPGRRPALRVQRVRAGDQARRAPVPVRRRGPVRERGQGLPAHEDERRDARHAVGAVGLERARGRDRADASVVSGAARARRSAPAGGGGGLRPPPTRALTRRT